MTAPMPPAATLIEAGGITDTGRKRPSNQDAFYLNPHHGIFIVSDGMGGANGGEIASDMVVVTLREALERVQVEAPELHPSDDPFMRQSPPPPHCSWKKSEQTSPSLAALLAAVERANQVVYQASQQNEAHRGMGATLAVALAHGSSWVTVNVGDSPIYLFRNGKIYSLYSPHTLEAALKHAGIDNAFPGSERTHHVLTKAMGVDANVVPDYCELPMVQDDILCLCSDGLSNKVDPDEIMAICRMFPPHDAGQKLVELANERGGEDNITVVICKALGAEDAHHGGALHRLGRGLAAWLRWPGSKTHATP